jgi:hypothetical protein
MRSFRAGYARFLQTESRRLGLAIDDVFDGQDEPSLERLRNAWRALPPEQLIAASRRHFALDRIQIALVAPEADAFADRLASEAPSPIEYEDRTVSEEIPAQDRVVEVLRIGIPANASKSFRWRTRPKVERVSEPHHSAEQSERHTPHRQCIERVIRWVGQRPCVPQRLFSAHSNRTLDPRNRSRAPAFPNASSRPTVR